MKIRFLLAILFNTLLGVLISPMLGISAAAGAIGLNVFSAAAGAMPAVAAGALQTGTLYQEYWEKTLLQRWLSNWAFTTKARDMSAAVKFNKINFAELGTPPDVLLNPTGAIASTMYASTPHAIDLEAFHTTNTLHDDLKNVELAFPELVAVQQQHVDQLKLFLAKYAVTKWAPQSNSADTPILEASGATGPDGRKLLKMNDVIDLMGKFNALNAPGDRVLVLHPTHQTALMKEDRLAFQPIFNPLTGMSTPGLYGFELVTSDITPRYDATTGAIIPYGATIPGGAFYGSFAFVKEECAWCIGDITLAYLPANMNPQYRLDMQGYKVRFAADNIRGKGSAAIISTT